MDIDRMERLARLLQSGALSQEEFDQKKAELLAPTQPLQPQASARGKWLWVFAAITLVTTIVVAAKVLPEGIVAPAPAPTTASPLGPASPEASSAKAVASSANIDQPSYKAPDVQSTGATEFTDKENILIDQWSEAEEMCRGSSDEQSIEIWCPRREKAMNALNRADICYGKDDDQSASDYQIHRCSESSFSN